MTKPPPMPCRVEDCPHPARKPNATTCEAHSRCSVPNCARYFVARGLCRNHWNRWKRGTLPDAFAPRQRIRRGSPCQTCGKPSYSRGLCMAHYRADMRRQRDPVTEMRWNRAYNYRITACDVARMLAGQAHACFVCKRPITEATCEVDHCHATGDVRGLLCGPCNKALGLLGDDAGVVAMGAAYLESSGWASRVPYLRGRARVRGDQ